MRTTGGQELIVCGPSSWVNILEILVTVGSLITTPRKTRAPVPTPALRGSWGYCVTRTDSFPGEAELIF